MGRDKRQRPSPTFDVSRKLALTQPLLRHHSTEARAAHDYLQPFNSHIIQRAAELYIQPQSAV